MSSRFRWDTEVRTALVGDAPPKRASVVAWRHGYFKPWAVRRVLMILRRDEAGEPVLLDWDFAEGRGRKALTAQVQARAAQLGLSACDER